jgi:hypothetical protein
MGEGSHQNPWKLRALATTAEIDPERVPLVVALDDDKDGYFQSSPPSPIDVAVVFRNMQRLGVKHAASSAVLAWDAPDVIGLAALEKSLQGFDSLVMAAPLGRGAVAEPIPQAFRAASLPLTKVRGDVSLLPVVNRLPLNGVVLGPDGSLAGFQTLDTESDQSMPPLLARWDDRLVFSFPLVVALRESTVPLEELEIHLGKYLRLGASGPIVPLDAHGRMLVPFDLADIPAGIAAASLIDRTEPLRPLGNTKFTLLRDDQSAAEYSTRNFSQHIASMVAAIGSDTALFRPKPYHRLPVRHEIGLLSLLVLLLTLALTLSPLVRLGAVSLLGAAIGFTQFLVFKSGIWLPITPLLALLLAGLAASAFVKRSHENRRRRKWW